MKKVYIFPGLLEGFSKKKCHFMNFFLKCNTKFILPTIFKNFDSDICCNSFYLFYEANINLSHSIMSKL